MGSHHSAAHPFGTSRAGHSDAEVEAELAEGMQWVERWELDAYFETDVEFPDSNGNPENWYGSRTTAPTDYVQCTRVCTYDSQVQLPHLRAD